MRTKLSPLFVLFLSKSTQRSDFTRKMKSFELYSRRVREVVFDGDSDGNFICAGFVSINRTQVYRQDRGFSQSKMFQIYEMISLYSISTQSIVNYISFNKKNEIEKKNCGEIVLCSFREFPTYPPPLPSELFPHFISTASPCHPRTNQHMNVFSGNLLHFFNIDITRQQRSWIKIPASILLSAVKIWIVIKNHVKCTTACSQLTTFILNIYDAINCIIFKCML